MYSEVKGLVHTEQRRKTAVFFSISVVEPLISNADKRRKRNADER